MVVVCRVVCEGALPRIVEEQDAEDLEDWELDPGSAKVTLLAPLCSFLSSPRKKKEGVCACNSLSCWMPISVYFYVTSPEFLKAQFQHASVYFLFVARNLTTILNRRHR